MGCQHSSPLINNDDHSCIDGDDSRSSSSSSSHQFRIGILPCIVKNRGDSNSNSSNSRSSDDSLSTQCQSTDELTKFDGIVSTFDQSIDDDCSRESVTDWLATTKSNHSSYMDAVKNSESVTSIQPPMLPLPPRRHLTDVSNNTEMKVYSSKTISVDRRHVALPTTKPDGLASGDFLRFRYIVNDYILMQIIGSGGHSEVRLSKNKATNALFAVKIMQKGKHQMVQQEIAILTKLSHPNVIKLYEVIDDQRVDKVYLVLEFLKRGDLMRIVESEGPYKEDVQLRGIVSQVMSGLQYLHDNNILQNDLKPSNVLVSDVGVVKIADFGISTICRIRRSDDHSGTPAFMAPEVVEGDAAFDGRQADVYSLGATCFYLRFGRPPFVGRNVSDLYLQIKTARLCFPGDENGSESLRDFISGLMTKDPLHRLCLKDALKHPWLDFTS